METFFKGVVSTVKNITTLWLILLTCSPIAMAQDAFQGAPNSQTGDFIKLKDHLDDPNRGLCIDIPGHLSGVNIFAPLVVHTCKDGFWNYDQRFLPDLLAKSNKLSMPSFKRCVAAEKMEQGARLKLAECLANAPNQDWEMIAGQLRLKARPKLCIEVDAQPSEVSIGTRNHPVRHLVRPIYLGQCAEQENKYQQWQFATPSDIPGIRYPDGRPGGW